MAQGTLPSVVWQPGWERSLGENGYMHMYMYVCVWLGSFDVHLKLSQHCNSTKFQHKIKI